MESNVSNTPMVMPNKDIFGDVLETNNLVLKVAVLLLTVVLFVIFFRFSVFFLGSYLSLDDSPKIVDGLKKAQTPYVVRQDPGYTDSVPILRSKNEENGIEFTWSVWMFIDDVTYLKDQYRHIFHKGNLNISTSSDGETEKGLNFPNNAPGLYLLPHTNDLLVKMNTFSNINEDVKVSNIPINKWINVLIRVQGKTLDVYINGLIVARKQLTDVPKQNYDNVYINQNGGFSGYISDLRYFDHAISITEVNRIMRKGPNLKTNEKTINASSPPYLSLNWYLYNDL